MGFEVYEGTVYGGLLENIKLAPPHKRLKAYLVRYALSDLEKPVHWKDIEPLYDEIERLREEMIAESKRLVEVLHPKWRGVKELWRTEQITWRQYEEERSQLEAQAWKALEALKEKYDKAFNDLEGRIKAASEPEGPEANPQVSLRAEFDLKFSIRSSCLVGASLIR